MRKSIFEDYFCFHFILYRYSRIKSLFSKIPCWNW